MSLLSCISSNSCHYPPSLPQVGYEEKLDSLQLEYTYLLTSQLESQRVYFEEKLTRVETAANEQVRHCATHHTMHCSLFTVRL